MTPERFEQINQLYHAALALAPIERAAFLDQTCAGDEALRQEVASLLAAEAQAGSFIEATPDDIAADLLAEPPAATTVGRRLGRYQLLSLLGAGGMGEVYRAKDTHLEREVAVKILPPQLAANPEALRRFEREAKAVAALSHPNILAIQEEIARHISESLRLKLSGGERQRLAKRQTTNIEAHQLYLKGHSYLYKADEGGLKQALEYFKQAIGLDPNYALAYAGMADAYVYLADNSSCPQRRRSRWRARRRRRPWSWMRR